MPQRWPDTFIVGAPRCGTSALHDYLGQHPQIFMSPRKEPLFYAPDLPDLPGQRISDPAQYTDLFSGATDQRRLGESSPYYLYSEAAADAIRQQNPDARIIVLLRNPADMMYSMYWAWSYAGFENARSFDEALEREKHHRGTPPLRFILRYRYLTRYSDHVERYLTAFGRSRVHVVIFDDLASDPLGMYRHTCRFLGVSVDYHPRFKLDSVHQAESRRPFNRRLTNFVSSPRFGSLVGPRVARVVRRSARRWGSKPPPPLKADVRRQIGHEYAAEIDRLSRAIGRDLSHWHT